MESTNSIPAATWEHSLSKPLLFLLGLPCILAAYIAYNLWLHPLAKYPGPFLARTSQFWLIRSMLRGTVHQDVLELHKKYGEVVRLSPNELAFTNPDAWKDIYGHRVGKSEVPKDPAFYHNISGGPKSIIATTQVRHGELRRLLSHGFSEKSLRDQEAWVQDYATMFINRLHDCCEKKGDQVEGVEDMVKWYNFFTFDVIGELAYGESFNCLESGNYHPWINFLLGNLKRGPYLRSLAYYTDAQKIIQNVMPRKLREAGKKYMQYSVDQATRRYERKEARPDFVYKMVAAVEKGEASMEEFIATTAILIIAGSETTATLLSGVTYMLVNNRDKLEKLVDEIRSAFSSEDQITFQRVQGLKYMLACLDEAGRMYPPVPNGLPRKTAKPEYIAGNHVPPNTTISIYQWAMNKSDNNYARPDEFIPERWLGDPEFQNDRKYGFQMFSVGPRNCIGKNLAYAEMRLILARLLFNFDIESTAEGADWSSQKTYGLWNKKPLPIKLKPVRRSM